MPSAGRTSMPRTLPPIPVIVTVFVTFFAAVSTCASVASPTSAATVSARAAVPRQVPASSVTAMRLSRMAFSICREAGIKSASHEPEDRMQPNSGIFAHQQPSAFESHSGRRLRRGWVGTRPSVLRPSRVESRQTAFGEAEKLNLRVFVLSMMSVLGWVLKFISQ